MNSKNNYELKISVNKKRKKIPLIIITIIITHFFSISSTNKKIDTNIHKDNLFSKGEKEIPSFCDRSLLPSESKDCTSLLTKDPNEECCFLLARPQGDLDFEKECINIKKNDTKSFKTLHSLVGKLTEGTYFISSSEEEDEDSGRNYPYDAVDEIVCPNTKYERSECEKAYYPSSYDECENLQTFDPEKETCCYLFGAYQNSIEYTPQCVNINKDDLTKLKEVKTKILNGEYWENFKGKFEMISQLRCNHPSNCESVKKPKQFKDCEGKKGETEDEECCFLYGFLEGTDSYEKTCIDMFSEDAQNNQKVAEAAAKLTRGEYWELFTHRYISIKELTCKRAAYMKSSCEKTDPDGVNDCKGKQTSVNYTNCCYINGVLDGVFMELKECAEINSSDIHDLELVRLLLKNGEYWNDYKVPYLSISNLTCPNSSNYLMGNFIFFFILGLLNFIF